jgi:class 3 adenylate cyclase/tetratricopeptide (TPR) repeat protein
MVDEGGETTPRVRGRDGDSARQTRKVVTALFCDVTGSTALGEQLDPELLREVLNRYFREIRTIIERHGGTVEKFIGDAVMAVFGIPRVQEDDALRAVRAAAEIRDRLPALAAEVGVELQFRTGVNTGPVLMAEGENLAVGDAINVAARLEQAAQPEEILIGEETFRLVRDAVVVEALEALTLKGKAQGVAAYRLLSVDPAAPGFARHLDVPLVGRVDELRLLCDVWERVERESNCYLVTLIGMAGVGKSRLVEELLSGMSDRATVLRGRCLPYGEGITFWPLVEALMPLGEPAQHVLSRLGSGGVAIPEELFWEVRLLLEALAAEWPVVLHIDDLQWAEPTLLDLLDHVGDVSRGAPILLLCTARLELLEDRPTWSGGKLNAFTLLLEPLAAAESEALLDQVSDGLDPDARARVIAGSEGNPLFLEEMAALARERGTVEIPPTIQALLAARLERLSVPEREVLERGAVEGEVFHRLTVRALADQSLAPEIDLHLAALVRKELIRPHPPTVTGDGAFRFRHLLIRDAAYDALPKSTRADLHERSASWLEQHAPDLIELDEIGGWHLEQAVRYQRELGRDVDSRLARRAGEHLYAAGKLAARRGDVAAAKNLLNRALALTKLHDAFHAEIALELAECLVDAGDTDAAETALEIAEAEPALAANATLVRLDWMAGPHPEEYLRGVAELLPAVVQELERRGDSRWLAKAHLVACWQHVMACQAGAAATELRKAADYATAARDEALRVRALSLYIVQLRHGSTPVIEIAHELDAIETGEPGPYLQAELDEARGNLAMFAGQFDEGRRLMQRDRDVLRALGHTGWYAATAGALARLELTAGNPAGARDVLLEADSIFAASGERGFRSTNQARLAVAYEQLGEPEAAAAAIELAEALSSKDDIVNFVIIDVVRARLSLADGDHREAERWARSAVELASHTDYVAEQATTKLELARVLAAGGKRDEALENAQAALALFEAKGDQPNAASARAVLANL